MTKLLEQAVNSVRQLPAASQDDIAQAMLMLVVEKEQAPVPVTLEERAAITHSKAAAERGEFAADAQVQQVWAKHNQ